MRRVAVVSAILAVVCSPEPDVCAAERPNIILMMADDLGWGDPSYNSGWISTPALDAMAASGLRFDRFYAASAVCSPTRASCLTGRNPYRVGIPTANAGKLGDDETPLSEVLQGVGYATGHFGKWHLGTMTTLRTDSNRGAAGNTGDYAPPWRHGYDFCFATEAKVPTFHPMRRSQNGLPEPAGFGDPNFYGTRYWTPPAVPTAAEGTAVEVTDNLSGDDSRVIMDRVIPFVRDAVAAGDPFFTVIWFHTPHKPLTDPDGLSGVDSSDAYADTIVGMDTQIARLRVELDTLGVADSTMFWFCSDNGPENGVGSAGPFRDRKRSLHEGGVRVPGLLVWPEKIPAGRTTDFPAVTSDYYPTVLDYLGISVPGQKPIDGISLRGVIEGTVAERSEPIGFRFENQLAWVSQRFKLISENGGSGYLLFDLLADPSEQINVASAYPEVVARMTDELQTWLGAVAADAAYVPPTEDVTVALSTANRVVQSPFDVGVAFSRSVDGLVAAAFEITNGSAAGLSGSGASYVLTVVPVTPGVVEIRLPSDAATDGDGQPNRASGTLSVYFGEPLPPGAAGKIILDEHFDIDGAPTGWITQGNGLAATHDLGASGSILVSSVTATAANTNRGPVATVALDPVARDGFVVTFVIAGVDQRPDTNGFFVGVVGDNTVFYRDESTRNFGLTFFGLESRTGSEAGFGLNFGDNFAAAGAAHRLADDDVQLASFLDGFTATVGVRPDGWVYEIQGLTDPMGSPKLFVGSGLWSQAGTDFNALFGGDRTWFAVASNQRALAAPHVIRIERVRVVEGGEPPPPLLGVAPDLSAGLATISWQALEGRRYLVERSANLLSWEELDEVTATARIRSFPDTDADSSRLRHFYRIRSLLGD